jgi:hypothetical protein
LGEGDFMFLWIVVLSDQIARVTGQHQVLDLALAARAKIDHFGDLNKMVGNWMFRYLAGDCGFGDNAREVAPLGVSQQMLNVARQPVFNATVRLLDMRPF